MAIALIPDGPRGRWERYGLVLLAVATAIVVALFVAFLIFEYVL